MADLMNEVDEGWFGFEGGLVEDHGFGLKAKSTLLC